MKKWSDTVQERVGWKGGESIGEGEKAITTSSFVGRGVKIGKDVLGRVEEVRERREESVALRCAASGPT